MSILMKQRLKEKSESADIPADDIYGGLWSNSYVNALVLRKCTRSLGRFIRFFNTLQWSYDFQLGRRSQRYHYGVDLKQTGDICL